MSKLVKISIVVPQKLSPASNSTEDFIIQVSSHLVAELEKVLPDKPDLILLPEMCDAPAEGKYDFSYNDFYRVRGDRIFSILSDIAVRNQCNICYSSPYFNADKTLVNATRIIGKDGKQNGEYHKNFPTLEEIECGVSPGTSHELINCDCGKIAGVICFDLNFDELRKEYAKQQPDIIAFSSLYHGSIMQPYWAYSCRAFFVAALGPALTMRSSIIAPNGRIIAATTNYLNYVTATINLDRQLLHLDYNKPKLDQLKRKYGELVTIDDIGELGSVLLYSNSVEFTVSDLMFEYKLESLDDYLDRARYCIKANKDQNKFKDNIAK